MKIDLTLCDALPDFYTSLFLLLEYFFILFLVIYRMNLGVLKKYSANEVYFYHLACIFTCILRILTFSYSMLLLVFPLPSLVLTILTLLSPLPFISGISILASTWMQMYLLISSFNQKQKTKLFSCRNFLLFVWNISLYAAVGVFIYLIDKDRTNCIKYLGDFFLGFACAWDILTSFFLISIGVMILIKIKKIMNTIPHRLLGWNIIVFFISLLRGFTLLFQTVYSYNILFDDSLLFSVFYVAILNIFEVLPILVFLKAIMMSALYISTGSGGSRFESTSMSSLINAIVPEDY